MYIIIIEVLHVHSSAMAYPIHGVGTASADCCAAEDVATGTHFEPTKDRHVVTGNF